MFRLSPLCKCMYFVNWKVTRLINVNGMSHRRLNFHMENELLQQWKCRLRLFWDVTLCSLVDGNQCLWSTYLLVHNQDICRAACPSVTLVTTYKTLTVLCWRRRQVNVIQTFSSEAESDTMCMMITVTRARKPIWFLLMPSCESIFINACFVNTEYKNRITRTSNHIYVTQDLTSVVQLHNTTVCLNTRHIQTALSVNLRSLCKFSVNYF